MRRCTALFLILLLGCLAVRTLRAQASCELQVSTAGGGFVTDQVNSTVIFAVGRGIDHVERRALLLFDVPSAARTSEWAELRVFAGRIKTTNSAETLTIHDVTTPLNQVVIGVAPSLFQDLSDGAVFGTFDLHPSDGAAAPNLTGALLRTRLTEAGLNSVRGAAGKRWAAGIAISALAPTEPEYALGQENGNLSAELVFGTTPTVGDTQVQIAALKSSPLLADQLSLVGQACAPTPMDLMWTRNGVVLPGETNEVLAFARLTSADSGSYALSAHNAAGITTSAPVEVMVVPLEIEALPTSLKFDLATSLEVKARSALPLTYQWRKDALNLQGATGSYLPLSVRNGLTNGNFDVIVSNAAGSVTSSVVRVAQTAPQPPPPPPDVTPQFYTYPPANLPAVLGLSYDFSPPQWQAYPPPSFSWEKYGQPLDPPETNSFIHFAALGRDHAGVYRAIISNRLGNARSSTFNLSPVPLTISGEPQYGWLGDSLVLKPAVQGLGPFSYSWSLNGHPVAGRTNSEFKIDFATAANSGRYTVTATNPFGSASADITLQVQTNLTALTLGGDVNYLLGKRAVLGVYYSGTQTDKWRWQWLKDGQLMPGETNRTLLIAQGAATDSGVYRLQFTIGNQAFLTLPSQVRFIAQDVTFHDAPALEIHEKLGAYTALGATAEAGPPPTYQWMKDGAVIPRATNSTLTFKQLKSRDAGNYVLVARNASSVARFTNTLSFDFHQTLDRWGWRAPLPHGSVLWTIAFGNGRFVAGGRAGIITESADGENWSATFLDPRLNVLSVQHQDGTFHLRTAVDPSLWPRESGWQIDHPPGITEFTSGDGLLWQPIQTVPLSTSSNLEEINYLSYTAPLNNHRYTATGQTIYRVAEENQSWGVQVLVITNGYFNGIRARSGALFAFVSNGNPNVSPYYYYSTDALNWEKQESPAWLTDVVYLGDILVATTSTDGQLAVRGADRQWHVVNVGTIQPIHDMAFGNGRYVGVGGAGAVITSRDGLNWSPVDSTQEIDLYGLAAKPGLAVAVGEAGTIWTSTNGLTWVAENSGTDRDLHDVCFGEGALVAVGRKGTLLTSSTGDSWHIQSTSTKSDLSRAAYAGGTWIVVGEDGVLLRSTDGTHWEKSDSNLITREPAAHEGIAFGQDLWVAVGGYFATLSGGAISSIILSRDDGRTWQSAKVTFGKRLRDVAYGAGYFVGVGNDGLVVVSQNGLDWGIVFLGSANFRRVRFAGDRFIVVGNGGVAFSSTRPGEQSSWQRHVLPTSQNVHNIAGLADGTFLAAGNNGMILKSASARTRFREIQEINGAIIAGVEPGVENSFDVESTLDFDHWTRIIEEPDNTFAVPPSFPRSFYRIQSKP